MKKLALLIVAAVPSIIFVMGADCSGSNVTPCPNGDADCVDAASPVCIAGTCEAAQCDSDDQCQATDAGGSDACSAQGDCDDGDACAVGDSGNNHCVTLNDPPGSDCGANFVEATGKDVDGNDIKFCADTGVSCADPGRCEGGQFG